jgi:hypothetical protein
MPRAAAPSFDQLGSSYRRDYGPVGGDPMTHCPATASGMKLTATTRSLNLGTSRATGYQLPGYTGFVPASGVNLAAQEQAEGASTREDAKVRLGRGEGGKASTGRQVLFEAVVQNRT